MIKSPVRQLVTTPGISGVYDVDLLEIKDMTIKQVSEHAMKNKCDDADMENRERRFWRSLGTGGEGADPIYGADILGTLFQNKEASGKVFVAITCTSFINLFTCRIIICVYVCM